MSALTVSDILPTNLLSELNLNPTWEKIRGYSFAGSIAISLYTFYITLNGVEVHCVPVHDSSTGQNQSLNCTDIAEGELSNPQTPYVNSQCATDKALTLQRHAGTIMLGISILILIVSSFWLHIRKVKDGIRTFSRARDKFLKLDLSKDEALKFCSRPLNGLESDHACPDEAKENLKARMKEAEYNAEAHKTVREIIRLFAYHMPENSMFAWYLIRNILLFLVVLATVVGFIIWIAKHPEQWSKDFNCAMNGISGISFQEFICTSNYGTTIFAYIVVYLLTVILQLAMVMRASDLCYPKGYFRNILKALCGEKYNRSPGLLIRFWDSATSSHTGLFEDIVKHIHSSKFKNKLNENMKSICENEDHELIRIKSKLFGNTPEVISTLHDIFSECSDSRLRIKMSVNAIKSAQYSINDDDVREKIAELIQEMKRRQMISNELIVAMLKNRDDEHGPSLSVVTDIVSLSDCENISRSDNSKRSILYYAFSKEYLHGPHKSAAAKVLCQGKHASDLKIYEMVFAEQEWDGNERSLSNYLESIYTEDKVAEILEEYGIRPQHFTAPSLASESSPLLENETSV